MVSRSARIAGDIDGLGLSPPYVAEQPAFHLHIAEHYIFYCALVAVLDAYTAIGSTDDTVVEQYVADPVHILRTYLHGARTAGHYAVCHHYVFTGSVLLKLPSVLEANAVVSALDEAVADAHLAAVIDIDAVSVTDFKVVQKADSIDIHVVTTHQMDCPIRTVAYGQISDIQLIHPIECKHVRTGVKERVTERLEFVAILEFRSHKSNGVAVYRAASAQADVFRITGIKPQHSFSAIRPESAELVYALVGIGEQYGAGLEMIVDVSLELHGAAKEGLACGEKHLSSPVGVTLVYGFLNGCAVVGESVSFGAEAGHVIHAPGLSAASQQADSCGNDSQNAFHIFGNIRADDRSRPP